MSIETIRDTLETIIVYNTEYQYDLATHKPDYKHPVDGACGALAREALAALSTINPEAIRSEARAETAALYERQYEELRTWNAERSTQERWGDMIARHKHERDVFILGDEPKERKA